MYILVKVAETLFPSLTVAGLQQNHSVNGE